MVDVDVHDPHSRGSVGPERRRGNRDVVEEAEAHRAVRLGMVPRRAHERERWLAVRECMARCLNRGARREQRDGLRPGARERVGVQHDRASRCRLDAIEIPGRMHARQFRPRRRTRLDDPSAARAPVRRHGIEHLRPLGPLGVPGRRHVLAKAR